MGALRGICMMIGHNWLRVRYPDTDDGSTFRRCNRCGKVDESVGGPTGPMVAGM